MDMDPDSVYGRVAAQFPDLSVADYATAAWRQAEIPAGNGHGNARSVGQSANCHGQWRQSVWVELLSAEGCKRALEPQIEGTDLLVGLPITYCMGYARKSGILPFGSEEGTIWWERRRVAHRPFIDTEAHVCSSYLMNQMSNDLLGDQRSHSLGLALHAGL